MKTETPTETRPEEETTPPVNDSITAVATGSGDQGKVSPDAGSPTTTCPRCGSVEDWGLASWCPTCGFYPTFDETPDAVDESLAFLDVEDATKTLWEVIPSWGYRVLAGVGVIVAANLVLRIYFLFCGGPRSSIARIEIVGGLLAALYSHFQASFIATNTSTKYGLVDMAMQPAKMWQPTFQRLPKNIHLVYGLAWGLTLATFGFLIGAFPSIFADPWVDYTPQGGPNIVQAAAAAAGGAQQNNGQSMEELLMQQAGQAEAINPATMNDGTGGLAPEEEEPEENSAPVADVNLAKYQSTECVVFGYLANEDRLDRVLLAKKRDGRFRHVATVDAGQVEAGIRRMLYVKLRERRQDEPFLDSIHRGEWVEPSVFVKVKFRDWTILNRMDDPWITEITSDVRSGRRRRSRRRNP